MGGCVQAGMGIKIPYVDKVCGALYDAVNEARPEQGCCFGWFSFIGKAKRVEKARGEAADRVLIDLCVLLWRSRVVRTLGSCATHVMRPSRLHPSDEPITIAPR
jgi:hypothetical protein